MPKPARRPLIGARNWAEHNATLEAVLRRAADYGITLNKSKCEFGQQELEFYGYRFSQQGLTPTPDKVKAVQECTAPTSKVRGTPVFPWHDRLPC